MATSISGAIVAEALVLNLVPPSKIGTGICFLDHMVDQFTSHGMLGVTLRCGIRGAADAPEFFVPLKDYAAALPGRPHDRDIVVACGTALGTYNSMLYGLCQFLSNPVMGTISDRIGRRPVFLFGAGADVVVFTLYGVFPTYWGFLLLGGVMGLLDGSNSACFAVIVDCITRGFMTGAPLPGDSDRELCFTRLLYSCARAPSSREGEPDMNYEFSLIYMVMWAWSLSGMIVGIAISTATVGYLGLAGGMASAGVLLLPYWLYLACYHPETLAGSQKLRCRHRAARS